MQLETNGYCYNCINSCNEEFTVSRLAETVCLSQKQLQRIFSEHVGASPKEFMRIVRFHKALYTLQNHPEMNFTTLAYELMVTNPGCSSTDLSCATAVDRRNCEHLLQKRHDKSLYPES